MKLGKKVLTYVASNTKDLHETIVNIERSGWDVEKTTIVSIISDNGTELHIELTCTNQELKQLYELKHR